MIEGARDDKSSRTRTAKSLPQMCDAPKKRAVQIFASRQIEYHPAEVVAHQTDGSLVNDAAFAGRATTFDTDDVARFGRRDPD